MVINDGARILTGSHDIESPDYDHVFKPIVIEDYAWIASGAILLQGVTIGRRAIVAAGAVVARDVPQDMVVAGNPARIVKNRGMRELRYKPSRFFAPYEAWLGKMPSI